MAEPRESRHAHEAWPLSPTPLARRSPAPARTLRPDLVHHHQDQGGCACVGRSRISVRATDRPIELCVQALLQRDGGCEVELLTRGCGMSSCVSHIAKLGIREVNIERTVNT